MRISFSLALLCALFVSACTDAPSAPMPTYFAEETPSNLSEWGQVTIEDRALALGADVAPYDLNTALFTDYAHKLRTIWMPEGVAATYKEETVFDFPVGAVITKTFYYPQAASGLADEVALTEISGELFDGAHLPLKRVKLIETRVLVNRAEGWEALSYRWNKEQTDATLLKTGDILPLTLVSADGAKEPFNYIVPNVNQCASCHATDSNTREIWPIGPKARHLNRDFDYPHGANNQLAHLQTVGYLTGVPGVDTAPKNAAWDDASAGIEALARSYLDINCSHCHSPVGPADTSGLFLEPHTIGPNLGLCKLPIAAGAGTGNRFWGIKPGDPEGSILWYRLNNTKPDVMMPEIGRSTIHDEGVALIAAWISQMDGECE